MAAGRVGQLHLGPGTEGAELQRHGERQPPRVQPPAELRREAPGEGETAFDPGLLVAKKLGDGCRAQLVIVTERDHDSGFVHGASGLTGGVGGKEPGLHGYTRHWLHHDGDLLPPFALPDHEALEAVNDLEASVSSLGYPQRHRGQSGLRIGTLPTEGSEGGTQLVKGDKLDRGHHW
jgi:hypothetical protein